MFERDESKKFEITQEHRKKFDIDNSQQRFPPQKTNNHFTLSESENIDRIIKKLKIRNDSNFDFAQPNLYAIDAQSGKLLDPRNQKGFRRIFQVKRRNVSYYIVSTQHSSECRLVCPVKDVANNRRIDIQIKFECRCESGNEKILVESLYREPTPWIGLKKAIISWVHDFQRSKSEVGVDFILNYFHLQHELLNRICIKAQQEFGLHLDAHLILKHEDQLKLYTINVSHFPVRVRGCDDDISIRYDAQLQYDEHNKILAILHYPQLPKLEIVITEEIRQVLLDNFSLNDISFELNQKVQNKIEERLREKLSAFGRTLVYFSLESTAGNLIPEEFTNVEHTVKCKIKEARTPISVEHRVLLSLEDIGKYRASRISSLEDWVKNKLNTISQNILFDKNYVDLLIDFQPDEIKQPMEEAAATIGYKIKHLAAIPDLEPLKLKDGFKVENEGTFVTQDPRVAVKLQIIVRGVIRDLRDIEQYLNPQVNILNKIKQTVHEVTEELIHDIDPQHFYTRFYYSDDQAKPSVQKELKTRITQKLENAYCASEISVTPKQLGSKIAERFLELQKGFHSFKVEIFPLREGGYGEPVKFIIYYKIKMVSEDGWYTFQSNDYQTCEEEVNNISRILEEDIKTKFETTSIRHIKYSDREIRNILEEEVRLSAEKIVSAFGLVVEIVTLRRMPTSSEEGIKEDLRSRRRIAEDTRETEYKMAQLTNKDHLTQLEQLFRKRLEFVDSGISEDDPELIETNKKIEQIIKATPSYSIKDDNQQLKQIESKTIKSLKLEAPLKDSNEESN